MAKHISDFSKSPQDILLDLINFSNPDAKLTLDMFTYGLPTVSSGSESDDRNTELTLTGRQEAGVVSSIPVYYNRLRLNEFIKDDDFVISKGADTKVSEIVAKLNAELGINITAADFEEADLPVFSGRPGEEHEVTITFNADSLVWLGSAKVTVRGEDIDIAALLTNVKLDGLNAPE